MRNILVTHRISRRVAGFFEGEGLVVTDDDNDDLALDGLEVNPMLQIHGYSITYPIATGKQQGRKVFTLQTIASLTAHTGETLFPGLGSIDITKTCY